MVWVEWSLAQWSEYLSENHPGIVHFLAEWVKKHGGYDQKSGRQLQSVTGFYARMT